MSSTSRRTTRPSRQSGPAPVGRGGPGLLPAPVGGRQRTVEEVTRRVVGGTALARAVPAVVLVLVVVLDWFTSTRFQAGSFLALVPGLSALLCGVRATVVYAFLAVAVYVLDVSAYPASGVDGWPGLILVAVCGLGAVAVCAVRMRQQRHLAHVNEVAETTRATVLRPLPQHWAGLEHAAAYLPSDVSARVGGDFYDIQPSPHGTRVVLGDVQGKGLDAVSAASALVSSFREAAYHQSELPAVATIMDIRMCRHREYVRSLGGDDGDRFATAALIGFPSAPPSGGPRAVRPPETVELVNCGHLRPLAVSPRGARELSPSPNLPLGMFQLTGEKPRSDLIRLAGDETLLLVSDGVTEARDQEGRFFPLARSVDAAVRATPSVAEPRRLVELVRNAVVRHSGRRLADDTTVLAVRRLADA